MAKNLQLKAHQRSSTAQATRQQNAVPAVLYGHGIKNQVLSVDQKSFTKVFKQAGYTTLINVTLEGDSDDVADHTVLIKEVQFHPVKDDIMHVDLYQVRMDQVIRARVPLAFVGESPAVKDLGGVLVRNMDEVELEALPNNLPHDIEVDITTLTEFDAPIRIADLSVPKEVQLFHEPDEVVTLVQPPRTEEELEAELAEDITEDVESVEGVEDKPAEGEEEGEATKSDTGQQEPETESKE